MSTLPISVVYAEDDELVRNTIVDMLIGGGMQVHPCDNGGAAIGLCELVVPDVVLLDLNMPGMDGFEAARRIRETASRARVPIVALTGQCDRENLRQAKLAGIDFVLCKPITARSLLQALRDCIKNADARGDAFATDSPLLAH